MDDKIYLARLLRKNATKQERVLWNLLRNSNLKNYKFKRQQPLGKYIVDFICKEKWLIIEVDGGVNLDNYQDIVRAGADFLVMGSAFYKSKEKNKLLYTIDKHYPKVADKN